MVMNSKPNEFSVLEKFLSYSYYLIFKVRFCFQLFLVSGKVSHFALLKI